VGDLIVSIVSIVSQLWEYGPINKGRLTMLTVLTIEFES
jgi:hypothetical protein